MDESYRLMWNRLVSSTTQKDGKIICLGTRYEGPMYNELRNRKDEEAVYYKEYAAPSDLILSDTKAVKEGLKAANPSCPKIKPMSAMLASYNRALAVPANEPAFRADELNTPIDKERTVICAMADFQKCIGEAQRDAHVSVSYTHLTLPTICSV